MGNNINGQSPVQQRNNVPNNDKANFTGANQMPAATPMSQSQILNQLMNMIQQLISALQGETKEQSTNKETPKKNEEKSKKQTDKSSSKEKTNTTDNAKNSTSTIKDSVRLPGETYNDTGLVRIKDQADGSSSSSDNSTTQRAAGAAGSTTTAPTLRTPGAYDAKFNIDPDLRTCTATQCIKTGNVDQDHTGSVGVIPYKYTPDFGLVNDPDRGWKTTGLNTSFRHTFHPAAPGQGEIYKPGETDANGNVTGGSYIEIKISRTTQGSLTGNDTFNLVSNGSAVGPGTSIWQQNNSSQLTDTLKIPLTAAQVLEIQNTGRASILVSDDTAVDNVKLHLDIGKQVPANTINGTTSDDDLKGKTGQSDIIHGLQGDDTIDGESGDDCLYGDEGDDHIRGGSGDDKAHGGTGDDTIEGGSGKDKLFGNEGDDRIFGGSGEDVIFGDEGDDELHGGSDNDKIYALDGNDTVFGDSGDDNIYSGLGPLDPTGQHNIIDGGSGDDTVHYSGRFDPNDPANSDYIVMTGGTNNEWTVIDKATGKRDIITNVEQLVFEMNPGGPFTFKITSDK